MLAPAGNWHGYQKYMFAASDFVRGAEKSVYGRTRTIPVDSLHLTVRLDITQAKVSTISENQFEELDVAVEILRPN